MEDKTQAGSTNGSAWDAGEAGRGKCCPVASPQGGPRLAEERLERR